MMENIPRVIISFIKFMMENSAFTCLHGPLNILYADICEMKIIHVQFKKVIVLKLIDYIFSKYL